MSGVYPAQEDSLFILKTLERVHADRVAEVGVGSGFVIREYVKANSPEVAVGSEIDIDSLKAARGRTSPEVIDYVLSSSCDAFREDCFHLVFFNPPYLRDEGQEDAAKSGGRKGIERTYEIVRSSYHSLKEGGSLIFLVSSLSEWKLLLRQLVKRGMRPELLASLKLFFEELLALEVRKASVNRRSL